MRILCTLAIAVLTLTACDDPYGPEAWEAIPDTLDLFSLSREQHQGRPSGFDLLAGLNGLPVTVEDAIGGGGWDFAVTEADGELQLIPSGIVRELERGAGIAPLSETDFEAVTKVPGESSLYREEEGVTMEVGKVYAIRSRRYYHFTGATCALYGKLAPISIDTESGVLRFEIVRNPNCNDRSMLSSK